MKRRGVKDVDPYDWEKLDQTANANLANIAGNLQINIHGKHEQVAYGNNVPSPMTAAGSNASGTDYVSTIVELLHPHTIDSIYMQFHIRRVASLSSFHFSVKCNKS